MTQWLKQSTAATLKLGPFVDDTDGKTAETGLTIAQGDILISKNGGAFGQTSEGSPTTTHDADGWYPIPLTTTDTGTLGRLDVQVAMAGALPVFASYMVVPAPTYDALISGAALADSVPADGNIPSWTQALYMLVQRLTEVGISSTTLTVYKVDGSTPLYTLTLGDATNPTTMTRAS